MFNTRSLHLPCTNIRCFISNNSAQRSGTKLRDVPYSDPETVHDVTFYDVTIPAVGSACVGPACVASRWGDWSRRASWAGGAS